jgi:P27 family predicted phage terminase small subunit
LQALPPPDYLPPTAQAEWNRISSELTRLGLLTALDTHCFAAYCQAFALWREAQRLLTKSGGALTVTSARGSEMPSPLLRIANNAAADMLKYGSEFGLTPASRSRVSVGPLPNGGSKLADLLA